MRTATLWDRLKCDVKENISWNKKKYPLTYGELVNDLLNCNCVNDLPLGSAMSILSLSKAYHMYEVYDLFTTNIQKYFDK